MRSTHAFTCRRPAAGRGQCRSQIGAHLLQVAYVARSAWLPHQPRTRASRNALSRTGHDRGQSLFWSRLRDRCPAVRTAGCQGRGDRGGASLGGRAARCDGRTAQTAGNKRYAFLESLALRPGSPHCAPRAHRSDASRLSRTGRARPAPRVTSRPAPGAATRGKPLRRRHFARPQVAPLSGPPGR